MADQRLKDGVTPVAHQRLCQSMRKLTAFGHDDRLAMVIREEISPLHGTKAPATSRQLTFWEAMP
eukprot:scaffold283639_cov12-Tisochrysis_lutea.AAC.1